MKYYTYVLILFTLSLLSMVNMNHKSLHYQSQGRALSFDMPHVMAILNVTPDSFYDGGKYLDAYQLKEQIQQLLDQGADSIDIGGMSSRPGASLVTLEEEWKRVELPIKLALDLGATVSIDTTKAEVAKRALQLGVHIVNDISAGEIDSEMLNVVGQANAIYVAMHMQGRPETMQLNPQYSSVTLEILSYFAHRLNVMKESNVNQVIIDPGFGFGKTLDQNYQLFNRLTSFQIFDQPILVGVSRKSMIYKLQDLSPKEALPGSLALALLALNQGARLLRVHDVAETVQVVKVFNQLKSNV